MGAHKKYRDMIEGLSKVDVQVSITREGYSLYKLSVGRTERIFKIRSTCNKHLRRIYLSETNKQLLFFNGEQ